MKSSFVKALAILMTCVSFSFADVVTTYTYDFSSGPEDASPASASNTNPWTTVSGFDTIASTEDQANTLPTNSGIRNNAAWMNCEVMGSNPSITGDAYQGFSISTVNWTDSFTVDRLQFDLGNFGLGNPPSDGAWLQVDVRASTDGFASQDVFLGSARITQQGRFDSPSESFDASFTGTFDDVNGTLEFRFISTSNVTDNGIETRLDNVALSISSVPEPSGLILLGGGSLLGLIRRRK